ncbi:MAG: GPW/gp25 family protein [Nannocystaceae bacterium]
MAAEIDDIVTNIQVILETCPNACTSNPKLGIDLAWQHACSAAGVAQTIAQALVAQLSQSEPRLEGVAIQHLAALNSRGPFLVIHGKIRGVASVLELKLTLRSQRQLVLNAFTVLPV